MDTPFPPLVLASTSPFRRAQLETLGLPFSAAAPDCDETPAAGESAAQTALRLAEGKARSLIGADQVAFCNGRQLGKPLTIERARAILAELSGRRIEFFSALCLLNTVSGCLHRHVDTTVVQMRSLTTAQINRYLEREPDALYCAGAAKSEGLGALLIERIDSSDPNALIGLPIFRLADFLLAEGVPLL